MIQTYNLFIIHNSQTNICGMLARKSIFQDQALGLGFLWSYWNYHVPVA